MSDLTEALDRIFNWLQQNHWSQFPGIENEPSLLQPGLTHAEIEEIVKDFQSDYLTKSTSYTSGEMALKQAIDGNMWDYSTSITIFQDSALGDF